MTTRMTSRLTHISTNRHPDWSMMVSSDRSSSFSSTVVRRKIKADEVHESIKNIKKVSKECKELQWKWEKDQHYEKLNEEYLAKAKELIGYVDTYRQQLDISWPKSKEIDDLKARNNKLTREKEDAEYFLGEARLEIDQLKKRQGEPPARTNPLSLGRRYPWHDHLPRHDNNSSFTPQKGEEQGRYYNKAAEEEIEDLKKQVEQLQEENKSLEQSQENERILQDNIDKLQKALSSERQAKAELQINLGQSQENKRTLQDNIDKLPKALSSERQAKAELQIKHDDVAVDNNPAVNILSDPYRPMKLAEKVSELYDFEWTVAMENLENYRKMKEEEAIKLLLDIVKNVFITLEDIGDAQTDFITSLELHIAVPDIDDLQDTALPLLNTGILTQLPAEITNQLRDYRKISGKAVRPLLFELMKSRLQRVHNIDADVIEACNGFIQETVSCIWMMRVLDPPLHIEWEFSHGEIFDHDRLRSYTKGENSVDYMVWPILYLHKGGPMLSKGVAQGMRTKPK